MLTDSQRCGKVMLMGEDDAKKKPPKKGWSTHDSRVLYAAVSKIFFLSFYLICGMARGMVGEIKLL